MVEHDDGSAVASHTEYVRTRVQCVRCGMRVSGRAEDGRRLCGGCRGGR
ncbi:hypothetical protein [Haloplanus salinus]|jgi:hypothetical protein|nr:hypothetical protein [Haloplanus salinus]